MKPYNTPYPHGPGRVLFCASVWIVSLIIAGCAVPQRPEAPISQAPQPFHASCTDAPERIILNLTPSPSTSMAVTWRTSVRTEDPTAQIAPVTGLADLENNAKTVPAETEQLRVGEAADAYYYSARFETLSPATVYAYRVGTADHWSEWNQFTTAKETHAPFSFVYFGDPQEEVKSMCSRMFRTAYKKAPDAGFWFFVGDLVDNGEIDAEWADLFYAFGWIPRTTPMVMLPGNHEYPDRRYIKPQDYKLFPFWRPQFTLPENGPRGLEETAYYFDYQGVRFVMLNGNEKLEEQARWLDTVLSGNPHPWTIVGIHQPAYSTARSRKDSKYQKLLVPVFDKYSVDLVLQGHDHTYCRTHKLLHGRVAAENERGTVYVISVSGPKCYPVQTPYENLMVRMESGKQLFQVIHIDHDRLTFTSYDAKGDLYDTFTLVKQSGKENGK